MAKTGAPIPPAETPERKLLVIDTTNTFELITARGTEESVTCRDLNGFFAGVWSVHPIATLTTSEGWTPRFGPPMEYRLNDHHVFIEGKVGRFPGLSRFFLLNFAIAQAATFVSLYRLIRREKISVIRAGDPLYTGLISWALARLTGIPFVVRVGGNHDKGYETTGKPIMPRLFRARRVEKVVERFVFRRADLVAGANQDNLDFALQNGARRDRATVFRYGNLIDRKHFVAPDERPAPGETLARLGVDAGRFLIYIGRLEPVKHPDHVLRVLAIVRGAGFDVDALLLGDGFELDNLRRLAAELGLTEHVRFAGSQPQSLLAEILPHCAVVVSPHTGRALAEAALAAAPIVAYDVDWQGELIESGRTGILVPHGDVAALATAVVRLLRDSREARRLGSAARERAIEMLDPEVLNEHEREAYCHLLYDHDTD